MVRSRFERHGKKVEPRGSANEISYLRFDQFFANALGRPHWIMNQWNGYSVQSYSWCIDVRFKADFLNDLFWTEK